MAQAQRLNSKVIEKSEEMAKAAGDSRKGNDYRWSAGLHRGRRLMVANHSKRGCGEPRAGRNLWLRAT